MREENVRSTIDEIALQVAQYDQAEDLETLIAAKTMDYLARLRAEQPTLTESEMDDIMGAVIRGVLKRLEQIAIGGGQIGNG